MADVPVSTLRAELRAWVERAQSGEEIVITERGAPVARLTATQPGPDLLAALMRLGVVTAPSEARDLAALDGPTDSAAGQVVRGHDANPHDGKAAETRGVPSFVRRLRW